MKLWPWNKTDSPEPYIHVIAIPLITSGLAILSVPGFGNFLVHWFDRHFHTGLDFSQPRWLGLGLLFVGVAVYAFERILSTCQACPFVALRHVSFAPISKPLSKADLPTVLRIRKFQETDCDLYPFMQSEPYQIEAAIRMQAAWTQKTKAAQSVLRSDQMGYYGIVHVPFQFLAGFSFSSFVRMHHFELDRNKSTWKELSVEPGPSLSIRTSIIGDELASEIAIRISISYAVSIDDIRGVMPTEFVDAHLSIASPKLDSISSYDQLTTVCKQFRELLDDPRVRSKSKHIFYSGPVSLGFALGQQISSTIHGRVTVYNFNANSPVRYPWGITLSLPEDTAHVRHV